MSSAIVSKGRFDPHDSARAQALAGVPLAPFGRRFCAYLIDFVLVILTWAPAEIARQYVVFTLRHERVEIHAEFDYHHWSNVVWLVLYFGLFVWATNGFTPGKKLMGIRVVSLTHARISFWRAVECALGYGASALEAGFGFVQYFTAKNHCCVHDRIAETIVIDERAMKRAAAEKQLERDGSGLRSFRGLPVFRPAQVVVHGDALGRFATGFGSIGLNAAGL